MKLSKQQSYWLKKNEVIIRGILNNRIEDLKDQLLDVPEEKRDLMIAFIKEYKTGIGLLKETNTDTSKKDFTGI